MKSQFAAIAAVMFAFVIAALPCGAQAPVRVARSVLEKYVGEYDQEGNTVRITLSGDTLYREMPGQRVALVPLSDNMFRMGFVFTAEFVIDQSGSLTQVLSDGVDIEYRLPRKGSRPAPPPPMPVASVRVPGSVLEQYVGVYEYIPGQMSRTDLRAIVRLKGDTLVRTLGGQRDVVLTPVSETKFRVGNTRLMVEFVIDDAGVTQVMGSGWQQMLARLTSR